MKKLKATMMMSRTSGTRDEMPMHIQITDELSGYRVVDLWMSFAEFSKALTSSEGKAEMEYFGNNRIGMRAENKTEIVPFDSYASRNNPTAMDSALAPFEVNGWKARRSDMTNHHCYVAGRDKNRAQRVVFFRHVDPETGEPVL